MASWKVDITLSHWKKLALFPLEFVPVEPADISEGSQSWGCCQAGARGNGQPPLEHHVIGNRAAQGLKDGVGWSEAGSSSMAVDSWSGRSVIPAPFSHKDKAESKGPRRGRLFLMSHHSPLHPGWLSFHPASPSRCHRINSSGLLSVQSYNLYNPLLWCPWWLASVQP